MRAGLRLVLSKVVVDVRCRLIEVLSEQSRKIRDKIDFEVETSQDVDCVCASMCIVVALDGNITLHCVDVPSQSDRPI